MFRDWRGRVGGPAACGCATQRVAPAGGSSLSTTNSPDSYYSHRGAGRGSYGLRKGPCSLQVPGVLVGGEDEAADRGFVIIGSARGILPYGPSLVSAARDLFSFVSAGEGPPKATAEEAPLDSRVKGIEDAVLGLRGGLEALREELQHRNLGGPADAQNLAGPSRGPARPKAKGAIPGLDALQHRNLGGPADAQNLAGPSRGPARPKAKGAIPGLDAAVLASARAAGIPENSWSRWASWAICKMTAILSQLARSRKPGSLEDLLDRGESAEAGGSSKAAAYQKLSTLLRDDPGKIASSVVLKLMSEDFSCHRSAPGLDGAKGAIPGLDAAVLASARAAGIPEEQLVKMGELASRAGKLGDGARAKASILSESEEEDVPGAGGAEESSPGNVSEAICKMTAILSQLARSRKPGSLEDLLDRGESAEAGSSGS
eukprot:s2154_g4.t1